MHNSLMKLGTQFLIFISIPSVGTAAAGIDTKGSLPYPFTPPSEEFCETNSAGDDVYISLFKPCYFVFYLSLDSNPLKIKNFQCASIDLKSTESVISRERRKILGWPDSCVANGPRCYDLKEYPNLRNFTLFGDTEYALTFPRDADIVSVDCSGDYAEAMKAMENLPLALGPMVNAIYFFSIVMLVSLVVCAGLCCCCMRKNRQDGYQTVDGVYRGPPVVARKNSEMSSQEQKNQVV